MVWNDQAHAIKNEEGIIIVYTGEHVLAYVDDTCQSDIGSDDVEEDSCGVGKKLTRRKGEHIYRAFNAAEWTSILSWLLLVST